MPFTLSSQPVTRRGFLPVIASRLFSNPYGSPKGRDYHLCLSPDAIEADPELLELVRAAGVSTVWVTGFMYGYWPYSLERIGQARRRIEKAGMASHAVNVPLGHPGDSLGAMHGDIPLSPPRHWKLAVRMDGKTHSGTSLHAPATAENVNAIGRLAAAGVRQVFLDDDFRVAQGPGQIGGCFCEDHLSRFLDRHGYAANKRTELTGAIQARELTPMVRQWIEFWCDELSASFRAQQKAASPAETGIMVMYLGSEKAGIRLSDYTRVPFRVGELMFDDRSFGPVKGKTDELFSVLFHRRFAPPELAYSETTAFPADRLSARNMSAKLIISTLADVRHTMFMSGLTPFPRSHWQSLGPAMRKQADLHSVIAGHAPRGPFKHYWGESSRMVGDDRPYSLFLACGVPFEVTQEPARDGWTFLSDRDARALAARRPDSDGTRFVARTPSASASTLLALPENLSELFAFKRRILPELAEVPVVMDDKPIVCAWYPSIRKVVLWNLSEGSTTCSLAYKGKRRELTLGALDSEIMALA